MKRTHQKSLLILCATLFIAGAGWLGTRTASGDGAASPALASAATHAVASPADEAPVQPGAVAQADDAQADDTACGTAGDGDATRDGATAESASCIPCTIGQPPRCPRCGSGCPGVCNGTCCECVCAEP